MLRVLGPVDIWRDDRSITVTGVKPRTLLAVLVLHANQAVSHDRLLTALWGSTVPASARRLLHNYLWGLRSLLADGESLEHASSGYLLRLRSGGCDLDLFTTETASARAALTAGDVTDAARRFRVALALWRGSALGGTHPDFQAAEGPRLEEQRLAALSYRIEADLRLGQHAEIIGELRHLIDDRPLDERLRGQLMLALYRAGRPSEALAVFRDLRRVLHAELGTEPEPDLQRLHQRVLASDSALHLPAPAVTVAPPSSAPRPENESIAPCQLPRAVGDFTSRDSEITHLMRETTSDAVSAVVIEAIDGMAGVGKTALAVHAAHRLAARFPDGQLFLDLHGHTPGRQPVTPLEALRTLLRATGTAQEKIPDDVEEAAALWRSVAACRRMLIVLDNAATTDQVRPLLPGRPGSHTLITSRRRLPGLDNVTVLSLDVLPPAEAIALFTRIIGAERAHAERRTVEEVAGLCGYLPLALRIAAARLLHRPAWTVQDLAIRLGEQQRRLRELRAGDRDVAAAFTVSYEQLTTMQQRLFRLLGLIPGDDFDAHTAAALTDLSLLEAESALEELLDTHLLQQHAADRYGFHDLLRDYAQQTCRTTESEAELSGAVDRLHAYYLATATLAVQALGHGDPHHRLFSKSEGSVKSPAVTTRDKAAAWLEAEHSNLVAAALAIHDTWAVDMSMTLWRYLYYHAHYSEALTLHRHASDIAQRFGDQNAHIQTLVNLGITCWKKTQYEQALQYHQQALALSRQIGDHATQSRVLINLGITCAMRGEYKQSNGYFERSLVLARETGNRQREGRNLSNLGVNYERMGCYRLALHYQEQALACARDIGDQATEGRALGSLGYTYGRVGRYELAVSHSRLALTVARQAGDRDWEVDVLNNLGTAYAGLHRYQEALTCYNQSLTFSREIENRSSQTETLGEIGNLYLQLGNHSEARDYHQQALDMVGEAGDLITKATVLNGLGQAACATNDPAKSLDYHRQALELARSIGHLYEQARAHRGIGDALYLTEHLGATESWQQALSIFTKLGAPEEDGLRAHLSAFSEHAG
ncbi:SARP family transcriptional regulator [Planomonospora sphaerica]|uniref:SARP family transcriptional regulator n=1 Tax=Planomonospora sphaerica TaxID=161355 RepID=A0A161LZ74_9ACTN|nr:AfsR/SARP family transcriptional regulator [Planomonospora sphaerica]GAT71319.1 SARP family transcriptional regulator [Planomonospora sphaerica]